jgi:cell division topological specificity factor
MTDHLELSPELIEAMKRDLVDVISRHVEVDRDKIEVNFERQDSALAMLANIPILSVSRPNGNPTPVPVETVQSPTTPNGAPPRVRKRRKRAAKKAAAASAAPASAAAQ